MVEKDPLLREVDEAMRQERYAGLWKRYRVPLISILSVAVFVAGGYSAYRSWQTSANESYTESFVAAVTLLEKGEANAADEAFDAIAAEHTGSKRALALLWRARAQEADGRLAAAHATLRSFAEQSDNSLWRDLACVKLLNTELVPKNCSGASSSPLVSILRANSAANQAVNGQFDSANGLIELVLEDPATPLTLQSDLALWRDVIAQQQTKASLDALRNESAE